MKALARINVRGDSTWKRRTEPEMGDQKAEELDAANTAKDHPLPSGSKYDWKHVLTPLELRAISTFLIVLGFVVLLISLCTDNWLFDGRLSIGLWSSCMRPDCSSGSDGIILRIESLIITRGMLVMAALCACLSLFIISVSFYNHRMGSISLGRISAIASFAASLFIFIGMAVYTNDLYDDKEEMEIESEWSFDAGWVSFALFVFAGSVTALLPYVESRE